MNKNLIIAVGITILFLGVVVSPMTLGYDVETSDNKHPVTITFKNRLLFMIVFIKNTGNNDFHNIPWKLKIRDSNDQYTFKYPNKPVSGNIDILKAQKTIKLRTPIIANGLDNYWALIEYWVDGVWHYERADGWVLGPLILLVYMSP